MFYGKWTAEEHTVSFDLDGGTYDGTGTITSQTAESGSQATAPDPAGMTRTDATYGTMTFGGWKDESGKGFNFDTRITRDIELKTIWNTDKTQLLTIAYNVNGGTGSFTDGNRYQDGSRAVIKGQPVAPEGRYFKGWKVGSSDLTIAGGSFRVNLVDADQTSKIVTLTAQYTDRPAYPTTVVYNANGGAFDDDTDTKTDSNAVINDDLYKESDFAFKGTAEAKGTEVGTYPMGLTSDMFENMNKNFDVVFEVEDGYLQITKKDVLGEDEEPEDNVNTDVRGEDDDPENKLKPDVRGEESEPEMKEEARAAVKGASQDGTDKGKDAKDGKGVRTGDDSMTRLCIYIAMMLAAIATAAIVVFRRQTCRKND